VDAARRRARPPRPAVHRRAHERGVGSDPLGWLAASSWITNGVRTRHGIDGPLIDLLLLG
jgi:hypothetical protein